MRNKDIINELKNIDVNLKTMRCVVKGIIKRLEKKEAKE